MVSPAETRGGSIFDHFRWIENFAPAFDVNGETIDVLYEPSAFYEELISLAKTAKHRIVLASLYLGTGELEKRLIDTLQTTLKNCDNRDGGNRVYLRFLLDYSRGTRGNVNSCTMVEPLKKQFGDRVDVALFHTPLLRGILKRILPDRWNEVVGVQHMKLYIFDDTLIISGANLSNDYFTNRQDRYIVIRECPEMAEFYSSIVEVVSTCSFRMQEGGDLVPCDYCKHHPYYGNKQSFCDMMKERISTVMDKWSNRHRPNLSNASKRLDTRLYALLQMGPIGIDTEDVVTRRILTEPSACVTPTESTQKIDIASGYFNLTTVYEDLILRRSFLDYRILMASPKANGFFNGTGMSGYIPAVYVHVARLFFNAVQQLKQNHRIALLEYFKEGWTFHAKGMWLTLLKDDYLPSASLIGSTNYGYRSLHRDLESQLVIVTENARLRQKLHTERERLFNYALPIDLSTFRRQDHAVPMIVRWIAKFWRNYF